MLLKRLLGSGHGIGSAQKLIVKILADETHYRCVRVNDVALLDGYVGNLAAYLGCDRGCLLILKVRAAAADNAADLGACRLSGGNAAGVAHLNADSAHNAVAG